MAAVAGPRRQRGEPGPVQAGLEDSHLLTIMSGRRRPLPGVATRRRFAWLRPALPDRSAAGMNQGLMAENRAVEICPGTSRPTEAIVGGQQLGQQGEGVPVAHLVAADALEGLSLPFGSRQLDQSAVGQFGTGLESDIELAVAAECLKAQLSSEGGWNAPQCRRRRR